MKKDDLRAENRPERVPIHKQKFLSAPQKPGYKRRYVNEVPGAIEAYKRAGWTIATDVELDDTHDGFSHVESQLGSVPRRVVNRGATARAATAVLMEIPEEYWLKDQRDKQKSIDEKEKRFDESGLLRANGMYGSVSRSFETKF